MLLPVIFSYNKSMGYDFFTHLMIDRMSRNSRLQQSFI